MNRFEVNVIREFSYTVEVEATSWFEAERAARKASVPRGRDMLLGPLAERGRDIVLEDLPVRSVDAVQQLGEPWLYGWSGDSPENSYLGRPDHYMNTDDLLVFQTAYGHRFTEEDVTLLLSRVSAEVGEVQSFWNGTGCNTFSVRLKTPFGKLSDEQVRKLMGPR
jgi:hypothetical protein